MKYSQEFLRFLQVCQCFAFQNLRWDGQRKLSSQEIAYLKGHVVASDACPNERPTKIEARVDQALKSPEWHTTERVLPIVLRTVPATAIHRICNDFEVDSQRLLDDYIDQNVQRVRKIVIFILRKEFGLSIESIQKLRVGLGRGAIKSLLDTAEAQLRGDEFFVNDVERAMQASFKRRREM